MFKKYLEEIKLRAGENTYYLYNKILTLFTNKPVSMDTVREIMKLDLSINTKKYYLSLWIRALKFSKIDCTEIEKFVNAIKVQEKIFTPPTKEDVEIIIHRTDDQKAKLIIALMAYAGLRIGEVVDIELADINLDKNIFIIRQTKNHTDRVCVINDKLKPILLDWLNSKERYQGKYLFNSPRANKYSTCYFKIYIKEHCIKTGYPTLHCHSFRHYFATMVYLNSGNNIHLTARACGHKSINTTMKYIATNINDIASAVNQL